MNDENNYEILWKKIQYSGISDNQERVDEFIRVVQSTEPRFDFYSVISEFSKFTRVVDDSKLSGSINEIHRSLDLIITKNPTVELKLLTIVTCGIVGSYCSRQMKDALSKRLVGCMLSEKLPIKNRLEWAIFCWNNWPVRLSGSDKYVFIDPIIDMFVVESAIEPNYTLKLFDGLSAENPHRANGYILNPYRENPEHFLLFARNVGHIRSQIVVDALIKLISEGTKGHLGYKVEFDKLNSACIELFEFTQISEELSVQKLEHILRLLILYSSPELPWYNQLHERLWVLEKEKIVPDKQSISNYFIIFLNCHKDANYKNDIEEQYVHWLTSYCRLESFSINDATVHTKEIINLISSALHKEYTSTRNAYFPQPVNNDLIEISITSLWEMIEYFYTNDKELYFYALESVIERPSFMEDTTDAVGEKASQLFTESFQEFCIFNTEKAARLVTYMISRSGYTNIEIYLGKLLDQVYPILCSINNELAMGVAREGRKNESSHMRLWQPKVQPKMQNRLVQLKAKLKALDTKFLPVRYTLPSRSTFPPLALGFFLAYISKINSVSLVSELVIFFSLKLLAVSAIVMLIRDIINNYKILSYAFVLCLVKNPNFNWRAKTVSQAIKIFGRRYVITFCLAIFLFYI